MYISQFGVSRQAMLVCECNRAVFKLPLSFHSGAWFRTGSLYWIIMIPNILGSIIHYNYNHQPIEVLNTAQLSWEYLRSKRFLKQLAAGGLHFLPVSQCRGWTLTTTIWLLNIAMENPLSTEVYSWENHLEICQDSMAMFNHQRVYQRTTRNIPLILGASMYCTFSILYTEYIPRITRTLDVS